MNETLVIIANLMESWKDKDRTGQIVVTITVNQGGARTIEITEKTNIKLK